MGARAGRGEQTLTPKSAARSASAWVIASLALVNLSACDQAQKPPGAENGAESGGLSQQDLRAVKPRPESFGAAATGETRAFYEGEFEAVGTEPDWKLTLLDDVVTFTRVGLEEVVALPSGRDIRQQGALVEAEPLMIVLRAGACEHASGEILPYTATVQFEDVAYEGCARRAAAGATPSWTAILPELLPAIDACLGRIEAAPARVTIAYLTGDGTVSVRLRDADGGRYECTATTDGASISAFEPISDRNVLDGESRPLFTRAPSAPPEGSCYANETAADAAGAALGWISERTC